VEAEEEVAAVPVEAVKVEMARKRRRKRLLRKKLLLPLICLAEETAETINYHFHYSNNDKE
jgi:hypothetical protein